MTSSRSFTLLVTHQTSLRQSSALLCYFITAPLSVEVPAGGSPCHLFACSLLHFSGCRFQTLQPTAGHHCIDVLCLTSPLQLWLNRVQPVPVFSLSDTSVKVLALLLLLAGVRANFMFCFFLPPWDIERKFAFAHLSGKTARLQQNLPQFYSESSSCDCQLIWVAIRIFALWFHLWLLQTNQLFHRIPVLASSRRERAHPWLAQMMESSRMHLYFLSSYKRSSLKVVN